MSSKSKYKSKAFAAIHSAVEGMNRAGTVEKSTIREFDDNCLVSAPKALSCRDIKKLRKKCGVSQPVFACYLNTSESTIEKWETGAKRPGGIALKLLSVVQKHGLGVLE